MQYRFYIADVTGFLFHDSAYMWQIPRIAPISDAVEDLEYITKNTVN